MLIKHLHKFYNKDVPWVQLIWNILYSNGQIPHASPEKGSFWFRDLMKFSDHFRGIAMATTGAGDTIMLWRDVWNGHHTMTELPRLYSYAKITKISVAQYLNNPDVHQNYHTPISLEASQELTTLNQIILEVQGNQQDRDRWTYIWGTLSALHPLWLLTLSNGYGSPKSPKKSKSLSGYFSGTG
jgi:hypothetical protein